MTLDPNLETMLQAMVTYNMMGLSRGGVEKARRGFRAVTADARPPNLVIPVASTADGEYPAAEGPLRYRVYRPDLEGPLPTVLFLHGGGWVIGDLDTHDNQARRICAEVGAVVVSAEYRLAPEHPFPAGVEDAWAALRWVWTTIAGFGGDPSRLAVAGDSAGATLATVAARRARDAARAGAPDAPRVAAQFLIYPGTDFAAEVTDYPSRTENGSDRLLTLEDIVWFAEQYVGPRGASGDLDLADPDLSPLRTPDLAGLAPAIVVVAEYDPLRDEGVAYAEALEKAGTPTTLLRMPGMIHGFFDLGPVSPAVEAAVVESCAVLKNRLS
ncbi:alpha/beta hydrolase [Spongisporangium articulatum]|uniref:Alpha/beta hydrolase n=1 Tax=Spongisporangium articulatum TaxID=3362603 RepID=A0ABW8AIQ2_9ACTN